jgi:hypothetical protein
MTMCFSAPRVPDPKPAPPAPDPNKAALAAAAEQRAQASGRASAASNILTRLSDEDVAASASKRTLGGGVLPAKKLLGQ